MYLGDSLEEKRESFELLRKGAKRLGKVYATIQAIIFCILMLVMLVAAESGGLMVLFFIPIGLPIHLFISYGIAYLWYFGFVTVKSWVVKWGWTGRDAMAAVGGSMAVSYIIGGRQTARITGGIWLAMFAIFMLCGFFAGLHTYSKVKKELKQATA